MSLPDLEEPLARLEENDVAAAIDLLEEKVSHIPAHVVAHLLLARAYEAHDEWQRALESWENVHFLVPNSPVAAEGKRRVLRNMGDDEVDPSPAPPSETQESMATAPDEPAPTQETEPPADDSASEGSSALQAFSDEMEQLRRQVEREAQQGIPQPEQSSESSPSSESAPESPEEKVEMFEEEEDANDLDRLIDELESARIEPDPDAETAPEPDLQSEAGEVVSETLARIHENQGNFQEAARIYAQLAEQEPERAEEFEQKAREMRKEADGSSGEE